MYKLKKIVGSNNFSAYFIKINSNYKKIGYNINALQQTAHLILLDAKSTFDVVNHDHMLRRLFHIGVQDKHWTLISSLHRDASSVVKWFWEQSTSFKIHQGVRQGGIVSTDIYKILQNPLLNSLQHSGLGSRV